MKIYFIFGKGGKMEIYIYIVQQQMGKICSI